MKVNTATGDLRRQIGEEPIAASPSISMVQPISVDGLSPKVQNVGKHHLTFSWDTPAVSWHQPAINFVGARWGIEERKGGGYQDWASWGNITLNRYSSHLAVYMYGLDKGTAYEFRVRPYNKASSMATTRSTPMVITPRGCVASVTCSGHGYCNTGDGCNCCITMRVGTIELNEREAACMVQTKEDDKCQSGWGCLRRSPGPRFRQPRSWSGFTCGATAGWAGVPGDACTSRSQ